ncbi:MAG: aldo/keto reductase [Alphaproteobacteria bacterium]
MEYTTLGRTGLRVGVAGFGCGGSSRLGQSTGASEAQSIALLHRAIDHGVNFFDTAAAYGSEAILGAAFRDVSRDSVVLSTKSHIASGGQPFDAARVVANLEHSLGQLNTDYVDIFHLHAVRPEAYDRAVDELVPALLREQEKGKIRHLGITESPPFDADHRMLQRAFDNEFWDVIMVGFHLMHQGARTSVFPITRARGIGTLAMFAVRAIFSDPAYLKTTVAELAAAGAVPRSIATDRPLNFLVHQAGATSVIDAAYRYARHQAGADVVLFGTGDPAHLDANIASILAPPLPSEDLHQIEKLFGALDGVGLDLPDNR